MAYGDARSVPRIRSTISPLRGQEQRTTRSGRGIGQPFTRGALFRMLSEPGLALPEGIRLVYLPSYTPEPYMSAG